MDAPDAGSYTAELFRAMASSAGWTVEQFLAQGLLPGTLLQRLPTLAEVATTAAFLASDHAATMTGTIVNLTGGALVD